MSPFDIEMERDMENKRKKITLEKLESFLIAFKPHSEIKVENGEVDMKLSFSEFTKFWINFSEYEFKYMKLASLDWRVKVTLDKEGES